MYWGWFSGPIGVIVSIALLVVYIAVLCRAITRPHRSAASRVAWVAAITFLPVVGIIAYAFLGETNIGRDRVRRLRNAEARLRRPNQQAADDLAATDASVFRLVSSIDDFVPTGGNDIRLAADSDTAIDELVADIDAAEHTVHIAFYIWLADNNGSKVAAAIVRAAERGVTCRIMIDALGSRAFAKTETFVAMKSAGAHCVIALRDVPRWGNLAVGRVDLRNHRKIVVIDDRIAYVGSQNCADPAFSPKPKFAPWVDIFFRCLGPIVAQQQWLFLTGWEAETAEQVGQVVSEQPTPGTAVGEMFGTGPTTRAGAMSDVFVATIGAARETLTITTPYFAPDDALLAAIRAAPLRGVRTILVLPARNDSKLVGLTARSHYEEMLEAGVEIYEYPLGLLHTKSITVDGHLSLIGSANMDRRSLELNYENNLLISDVTVTETILERQQTYIDASYPVLLETVQSASLGSRLVQNAVGMLAPIL